MRAYPIHGQRAVSRATRGERPLCACVQPGARGLLYAWIGCTSCWGTGGAGASPVLHKPARVCNRGSYSEGM